MEAQQLTSKCTQCGCVKEPPSKGIMHAILDIAINECVHSKRGKMPKYGILEDEY